MVDFKLIKIRKKRKLYQIIYNHLNYIADLNDYSLLNNYLNDLKSYLNGYTPKNKLFKILRKVHLKEPYLNLIYLLKFCENILNYLKYPEIKRFIDLIVYAKETSKLGFLLLITASNETLNQINIDHISIIDVFSYILLNYDSLLSQRKIHFANQDIIDFNLTIKDNRYIVNNNLYMIWNRLAHKVRESMSNYKKAITFFDDCQNLLINSYLKDITSKLNKYSFDTFTKLTE